MKLEKILDFLNETDLKSLEDFTLAKSPNELKKGQCLSYIPHNKYKLYKCGFVASIDDDIIKITRYYSKRTKHIYFHENHVFYRKSSSRLSRRELFELLMNGLSNNSVKITKLDN